MRIMAKTDLTKKIVFYDIEFTREHQFTSPISIGMVSSNGSKEFYAEFTDYDYSQVDQWLQTNVIDLLTLQDEQDGFLEKSSSKTLVKGNVEHVLCSSGGLNDWISQWGRPIIMASFSNSYDWVLFREMFKKANIDFLLNEIEFFLPPPAFIVKLLYLFNPVKLVFDDMVTSPSLPSP